MPDFDFTLRNGLTVNDNVIVYGNTMSIGSVQTYIASNISIGVTDTVIDSIKTNEMRSATYYMQVSSGNTEHQVSQISIVHNNASSQLTEYGLITTGQYPLATFKTDINNGNVRLLATMHFGTGTVHYNKTTI